MAAFAWLLRIFWLKLLSYSFPRKSLSGPHRTSSNACSNRWSAKKLKKDSYSHTYHCFLGVASSKKCYSTNYSYLKLANCDNCFISWVRSLGPVWLSPFPKCSPYIVYLQKPGVMLGKSHLISSPFSTCCLLYNVKKLRFCVFYVSSYSFGVGNLEQCYSLLSKSSLREKCDKNIFMVLHDLYFLRKNH